MSSADIACTYAATKSKAKQYEFKLEEQHHTNLAGNPDNLLILSIRILGELASMERRRPIFETKIESEYGNLKDQLVLIAQYFDALDQVSLDQEKSIYLRLVGASAYYLAEMPGSASVLSKDLEHLVEELEMHTCVAHGRNVSLLPWLLAPGCCCCGTGPDTSANKNFRDLYIGPAEAYVDDAEKVFNFVARHRTMPIEDQFRAMVDRGEIDIAAASGALASGPAWVVAVSGNSPWSTWSCF